MIWPFKKLPVTTLAEEAAKLPTPRCGNGEQHLWWHVMGGMPCPACHAIIEREKERAREDRMAGKIAAETVRRMADPYRNHLADQAAAINLERLAKALTVMGTAGPHSQEDCGARLAEMVNRLTASVERFGQRPT